MVELVFYGEPEGVVVQVHSFLFEFVVGDDVLACVISVVAAAIRVS